MIQIHKLPRIYSKLLHIVGISLGKKDPPLLRWRVFCFYEVFFFFKVSAIVNEMKVKQNKAIKLNFNVDALAKNPKKTGPSKKPKNPDPDINDIPCAESIFSIFPPILNNSGTITENPKPTKPKPKKAI